VAAAHRDREALKKLALNPEIDLLASVPAGDGQTYLRELLLVADHTAYHLGELAFSVGVVPVSALIVLFGRACRRATAPGTPERAFLALCLALPEVTVRVDASRVKARSTAHSFDIRRRSFCLLVAVESRTGQAVPLLVLRVDPDDREALLANGHPFFPARSGRDRIVVRLTDDTDWEEIRELVTESYRVLAPKKLTALLD